MTGEQRTHALAEALDGIALATDLPTRRRKSRDFFWYSPILSERLASACADLIATPADLGEVRRILSACATLGVPVTARGAGTGNYGQATPLAGGLVLDMTRIAGVEWLRDGVVRVRAGTNILDLADWLRERGAELRMYPSTKRTATIGGLVCGGAGGVGSVTWGMLWEPGNIVTIDVLTMEPEPRIVTLRGGRCRLVARCFGTTGIVTAIELPVQPLVAWRDVLVAFDELPAALLFGQCFTAQQGIEKALCSVSEAAIVRAFEPIRDRVAGGGDVALLMVAPHSMDATADEVRRQGGRIVSDESALDNERMPGRTPLYEFSYNHTTLQVLKQDRGVTYLQTGFPPDDLVGKLDACRALFGAELLTHLEFVRIGGVATCTGAQIVRYTTPDRLHEIMRTLERIGIAVFNPHVVSLEAMSGGRADFSEQLDFKHAVDGDGLLNPGKLETFRPRQRP